jgi:glycosyltransferase involved in cell wall biosynthesis
MARLCVLHLVVAGEIGGAERVVVDLATRPDRTGADHHVALMTPNRALAKYFHDAGLKVHDRGPVQETPLAFLRTALGEADVAWLCGLVDRERIDLVHTHTLGSHVLGTRASLRTSRPQVRTEHHVMHYHDLSSSPFTRWAAARTDRLVAVSEYVRQVLRRLTPSTSGKTTVVRNGVDAAYWAPRPRRDSTFRLGVVSRLAAWKRVHLAIRAAAYARVPLWVVGDGEERTRLEHRARRWGADVRFYGRQADPRPFLAECDAIVNASDGEPLGLSILEALSMERPVIAFAEGGIPEIVADGVSGMLVSPSNAGALARAFERARDNRAAMATMGAAGRAFVVQHATVECTAEGYRDVYRSVA